MRKSLYFIIILVSLFHTEAFSENKFGLHAGISFSSLHNTNSETISGKHFGAFGDFYLIKNLAISLSINYLTMGGRLNNINVNPYAGEDVYAYDFKVVLDYLDFPIKLKYNIPIRKGLFFIQPFMGYSLFSLPVKDKSKRENKKFVGKINDIIPDVQALGDPAKQNVVSGLNFGISFNYKHFGLCINYFYAHKSLGGFDTVEPIGAGLKGQTISILTKYNF